MVMFFIENSYSSLYQNCIITIVLFKSSLLSCLSYPNYLVMSS